MRRLLGILLLTGAAFIVIAALLVIGLRLALPHFDAWCPAILNKIESATDESWLGILAGTNTGDGSQAWRYFLENLM